MLLTAAELNEIGKKSSRVHLIEGRFFVVEMFVQVRHHRGYDYRVHGGQWHGVVCNGRLASWVNRRRNTTYRMLHFSSNWAASAAHWPRERRRQSASCSSPTRPQDRRCLEWPPRGNLPITLSVDSTTCVNELTVERQVRKQVSRTCLDFHGHFECILGKLNDVVAALLEIIHC